MTVRGVHTTGFCFGGCCFFLGWDEASTEGALGVLVNLASNPQRAQYPLIKEDGLNYKGLHIMV